MNAPRAGALRAPSGPPPAPRHTWRIALAALLALFLPRCAWLNSQGWWPWGGEAATAAPQSEQLAGELAPEDVLGAEDLFIEEPPLESVGYGNVPAIRVRTPDGWNLAVYHYPPPGELAKINPVVLVHGEGFNRYIWDFEEDHSLARVLAENLFDTWVVELRGHGHSRPEEAAPSPAAQWRFEDYVTDVSAVVDFVLAQTGTSQVNLVGHSTGGVLVYGMLENEQYSRKIAAAVTLGAPTLFKMANDTLTSLFIHREKAYEGDFLDLRRGRFIPAPFADNTETIYSVLFFNDQFLNPDLVERFSDVGLEKVRVQILKQFADWFAEEQAYSTETASFNYNEDLSLIRAPMCVFVGWRDNVAQPENVIESLANVEPSLLTIELFGKMNGHQDYYGHLGLLLNDYAYVDVYPRVVGCLDEAALQLEKGGYFGPSYQAPVPGEPAGPQAPAPAPEREFRPAEELPGQEPAPAPEEPESPDAFEGQAEEIPLDAIPEDVPVFEAPAGE